ncbi:expansin family protein [Laccaria bicolor S238N-H82]|uniref:Expansin family protein n=1 Tax=Laccaria bicolor (strain S238N-H82 / ATCC MYA-4686) TaxID=486041 RepID=B0CY24_LACBS|nr:expansin family protein [Laccaria bicolor S238N-H82]EDR12818.1 expansin family protein [Laccaria bicolor S238N-H82]|eukprot:XP_001877082.1 expansin family protein [Laccaria bicolor S238N-H82]
MLHARAIFLAVFFLTLRVLAKQSTPVRAISESKYTTAHSLGDSYKFDPRDGWQTVNVTNLQYKYPRDASVSKPKSSKAIAPSNGLSVAVDSVKNVLKGLKLIGEPKPVTVTWYTGQDLQNPSCWANGKWAPTDDSFACALTMQGWTGRPKCFEFLELCNSPTKCVYVRVVDTCAGCQAGSKHVDLTQAAFKQLATLDEGLLKNVQLRTAASEPDDW